VWPVLGQIWQAFCKFYGKFVEVNNNWEKSPIIFNPLCKKNQRGDLINEQIFLHNAPPIAARFASRLTVGDVWKDGQMVQLENINRNAAVQISLVTYMRISEYSRFWSKKKFIHDNKAVSCTLSEFLSRFRKGSRSFRNVLISYRKEKASKIRMKCLTSFVNATGLALEPARVPVPAPVPVPVPDLTVSLDMLANNKVLELWNCNFVENRQRDFLYKFVSNRLSLNARLEHYNIAVNGSCTICVINGANPAPRESFTHLFYDCEYTNDIRNKADREFWPEIVLNGDLRKLFWLCGITGEPVRDAHNLFLQMTIMCVQFYVWECKIKKQKLSWASCKNFTLEKLRNMCKISMKFIDARANCNISISRRV
jgi:hypothetical protein